MEDTDTVGSAEMSSARPQQKRRLERNAREQRRSKRITDQIEQLRGLLQSAGRSVKANKASVLAETADYIQDLQKENSVMQSGSGCIGLLSSDDSSHPGSRSSSSSASTSVTQSASEGDLQSSAFTKRSEGNEMRNGSILDAWTTRGLLGAVGKSSGTQAKRRVLTSHCYRLAFNDSGVPMAIATMDGCFVDCNKSFLRTTSYTMDELMKLTIFNLTAPSDLQQTFSKVSQMIRSTVDMPYFETRAVSRHIVNVNYSNSLYLR